MANATAHPHAFPLPQSGRSGPATRPGGPTRPRNRREAARALRALRAGRRQGVELPPPAPVEPAAPVWDRDGAVQALNAAADEVLDWCGADDTGARDVVNLVVNVFGAYLDAPGSHYPSIEEVIEESYDPAEDDDPPMTEQVYDWCNS